MASVLVVDDQASARQHLREALCEAGLEVFEAGDGEEAWRLLANRPADVVVTDLRMPRCDGLELLRRIRAGSDVPVIVVTGHGSVEVAARAFKAGADEFLHGPDVERGELVRLVRQSAGDRAAGEIPGEIARRLVGRSPAIEQLRWRVAGLAPLSCAVLVSGEAGVGKRTVVGLLHALGGTSGRSLREIDAARFEPGSVSGGEAQGAVALHDVERLPAAGQRELALALRRAEPAGASRGPRLLCVTSDPAGLERRVQTGRFDAALARALQRFDLAVPDLSERPEDLADIARAMASRTGAALGRPAARLSDGALEALLRHPLPGRLTQLARLVERAVAFSDGHSIPRQVVESLIEEEAPSIATLRARRREDEYLALVEALHETGGNIARVAERLGRSRPTIYRMIERHGIALERGRGRDEA